MKSIGVTLWTEGLKVRKSIVLWLTMVFFVFVAFMMGLITFVQMHPEIAEKLGLIGTKANLLKFGEPNWQNYFILIKQGISGVGLIGFGFITCWVFGREYSDKTIKDLLALPVSRSSVVLSKLIIVFVWSILLSCIFFAFSLLFGYMSGVQGWTKEIFSSFASIFSQICLLSILLSTPIAFLASYSRGFLLPIGFMILTMMMANFTGLVGLGPYFPWAIPGMLSVPGGHLEVASYSILIGTCILGLGGTLAWWQFADQK